MPLLERNVSSRQTGPSVFPVEINHKRKQNKIIILVSKEVALWHVPITWLQHFSCFRWVFCAGIELEGSAFKAAPPWICCHNSFIRFWLKYTYYKSESSYNTQVTPSFTPPMFNNQNKKRSKKRGTQDSLQKVQINYLHTQHGLLDGILE